MFQPPKTPLRLLRWLCSSERLEEIEGDLFEAYQDWRETRSKLSSNLLYTYTLIRDIILFSKEPSFSHSIFPHMIKHYLKTAWRSMLHEKSFTLINLFGLSVGLASSLMLILLIIEQARKDFDLPDKDRIYKVESNIGINPSEGFLSRTHPGVGPFLKQVMPQVEGYTIVNKNERDLVFTDDEKKNYFTEDFLKADSSFFDIFPQTFLRGNSQIALRSFSDIVLTESAAYKYFGSENPIGKEIEIVSNRRNPFTVSAIVKDPPPHASIQFNLIIPQDIEYGITSPGYDGTNVYLKLAPNTNIPSFEKEANQQIKSVVSGPLMTSIKFRLKPFEEVKYDLEIPNDVIIPTDKRLYGIFTTIAVAILLLAIINYINLSAARSLKRGQEAGVRKILGAGKGSFLSQFLTESWLLCLLALPISILLVESFTPYFEQALNTKLSFRYYSDITFIVCTIGIIFITGLIAGLYPALLISRFSFNQFLKGKISTSSKGQLIRKALVIFQFAMAIILIVGAMIVQRQLNLFQQQKLSYAPEQIVVLDRALSQNFDLIRADVKKLSGIEHVSISTSPPAGNNMRFSTDALNLGQIVQGHNIDEHYAPLLNLEFVSGENFDPKKLSDYTPTVIINETMANLLLEVNPKNAEHPLEVSYPFMYNEEARIQGVVKDFHLESLHEKIKPMVFFYESFNGYNGAFSLIKLNTTNIQETMASIEEVWQKHIPTSPFRYQFLDSRFNNLYTTEMRLGKIFQIFTTIALMVSCLGLFGLVTFIIQSKVKEIAIRKVMGAKITQVLSIFLKEIYWLIGLSSLIGIPIAYWLMNKWLQDFAYHTNIPLSVTLFTVLLMLSIASLTVSMRTLKTARMNPVESLRND